MLIKLLVAPIIDLLKGNRHSHRLDHGVGNHQAVVNAVAFLEQQPAVAADEFDHLEHFQFGRNRTPALTNPRTAQCGLPSPDTPVLPDGDA